MAPEVDWQAAEQIARLFRDSTAMVWELRNTADSARRDNVSIIRADGTVIAVARPAA